MSSSAPTAMARLAIGLTLAGLVGAVTATAAPAQAQPATPDPSTGAQVIEIPQHPGPPGTRTARHPLMVKVLGHDAQGRPLVATPGPGGYTAAQLEAVVGLQGTGEGQTVAVVDAFDDPYATQDLNTYSTQMGLPGVCKTSHTKKNCFHFTQLHPDGVGGFDTGWALETSLDIEMIHALAPKASITLVEAADNTNDAMFRAVDYAASLHPAAISNSWGFDGESPDEVSFDQHCQLTDSVCVFSSGDTGNPGGYPAYNPTVLAVGGTTLSLDRAGTVLDEVAWSCSGSSTCRPNLGGGGGSGGGVSQFEPRPAYQDQVNPNPGRGIPDVSFDADPFTGVAVYFTGLDGWLQVGGTSAGAPAWAGILAAADQLRAAAGKPPLTAAGDQVQNAVYQVSTGLADITSGTNGDCGAVCAAGPGYDFVTGLGSPRPGIDTALAAAL